jgi:hypothetical protein
VSRKLCRKIGREYNFHGRPKYVFIELSLGTRSGAAMTRELRIEIHVFWLGSVLPWAVTVFCCPIMGFLA